MRTLRIYIKTKDNVRAGTLSNQSYKHLNCTVLNVTKQNFLQPHNKVTAWNITPR